MTDKRKRGSKKKTIKSDMNDNLPQDIHNTINGKDVIVKADASISSTALNSPPSNVNLPVSRFGNKQKSYNALAVSGGHIYEEQIKDLQWPRAYHTYNMMANDDAVS